MGCGERFNKRRATLRDSANDVKERSVAVSLEKENTDPVTVQITVEGEPANRRRRQAKRCCGIPSSQPIRSSQPRSLFCENTLFARKDGGTELCCTVVVVIIGCCQQANKRSKDSLL